MTHHDADLCRRWGENVRAARVKLRWTQVILARRAAVSARTISAVENGEREPSPVVRKSIATALQVDQRKLFPDR